MLKESKSKAEHSPLNKSKTGTFDEADQKVKKLKLHKTSTMIKSPKQPSNMVSGRNQAVKNVRTDGTSNDYVFSSPATTLPQGGGGAHATKASASK